MKRRLVLHKTSALLPGFLVLLLLVGCEFGTSVKLSGGPTFSFDGSGRLISFSVYGPRVGRKIATPMDVKSLMWNVRPVDKFASGSLIAGVRFMYGSVPQGYAQTFPGVGPALPLGYGQIYAFIADTTGAQGTHGFIYTGADGPILINVPNLCESSFVGDVKPVKCGTNEPFVEPINLDEFVRENRVN
jgi:hypothetical protein